MEMETIVIEEMKRINEEQYEITDGGKIFGVGELLENEPVAAQKFSETKLEEAMEASGLEKMSEKIGFLKSSEAGNSNDHSLESARERTFVYGNN